MLLLVVVASVASDRTLATSKEERFEAGIKALLDCTTVRSWIRNKTIAKRTTLFCFRRNVRVVLTVKRFFFCIVRSIFCVGSPFVDLKMVGASDRADIPPAGSSFLGRVARKQWKEHQQVSFLKFWSEVRFFMFG
jgi:hypothetical protein